MQYIKECLQLLYWIYFKPFTLTRHVRAICPEIKNPHNIYKRSAKAKANPLLQRYDEQGWWLIVLVSIAAVFLSVPLAEGVAQLLDRPDVLQQFNWTSISLFLLGWLVGQMIVRAVRNKQGEKSALLVVIIAVALLLSFESLIDHLVADSFIRQAVFSVTGGVALGVTFGVAFGMATYFTVGTVIDFTVGVVFGAVFSVTFGVTGDAAVGMAIGISLILGVLRIWFWLPELFWMFCLKLVPVPAARCLPWLPPSFDQLIILPLPFMSSFIAEAYQENRTAARQTIDYLITSTNQQKTARKAMSLIAAEECRRCQTTRDIKAIREQLSWLSEEPSPGLAACLDISQDVTAALEASSPYRKVEQLDKVLQKIDRQRTALAAASAREATSFGSVLDSWQGILETARKTLHEQAARSNEIPQVYLAGPALDPNKAGPLFKGRQDLFRQIETLTLSAQHPTLVMHGGRRSGKTSTLNYLPKWLPSDILPLQVECQALASLTTLESFAEFFAKQIIRSARTVHGLRLPSPDSERLKRDPFAALFDWIDAAEGVVPNKTLLICLDEFERLDEIVRSTDSRAPLNFLRHLIQHRDRWTLLFTGVLTPEELPAYWSDYLINCETLRVSYLAEADCLELIQHPVDDFPDIYPDPVAHAIRDLTGGQPYFTQLLCHELVEQLNRKKAKTVHRDDLDTVLPAVFERGYQVFREFRQSLTEPQQALLLAVAEEKTPSEEAMRAAPVLVRKEIIAPQNGGWCFRVPLIRRWLLEGQDSLS